jgi:hypothetical protein
MEPRLAPVHPPYDEDVERLLGKLMPPDAPFDPLLLFRVLAIHRDLADRMRPMASGLNVRKRAIRSERVSKPIPGASGGRTEPSSTTASSANPPKGWKLCGFASGVVTLRTS